MKNSIVKTRVVDGVTTNKTYVGDAESGLQNTIKLGMALYKDTAISTLLNTTYWKNFVNETYATSAIGSPTIEMFVNSWNAKFRGNSDYAVLSCKYDDSSSGSGYYLGTDGKADSNNLPVKGYNKSGAEFIGLKSIR